MKNTIFAIQDTSGKFFIKNHNLGGFNVPKFGNDHTIKIFNSKDSAQLIADEIRVPVKVTEIIAN
jgi:hypothetical protein|tara:strand:+ start:558 stop:752 length:195 start_codon:yes stop_codon:yes gene_type:complete